MGTEAEIKELARLHALEAEVKLSRAVCERIAEGLDTTITGEEQDALILTGANELNNLLLRQESAQADVLAELVKLRALRDTVEAVADCLLANCDGYAREAGRALRRAASRND